MRKLHWALVWLIQIIISALIGLGVAALHPLGRSYDVVAWIVPGALGLLTAYRATRRGLNNYLAWIAPPVLMAAAHLLLWTYLPSPGPVMAAALLSIIGAAAGEVKNRM